MSDNQTAEVLAEDLAKAKFIYAAVNAAKDLKKGHKREFLCPCCGRTAFIAKEPDIGDQYAWCECGMKHYMQQMEQEQEQQQRKKHFRSSDMEL